MGYDPKPKTFEEAVDLLFQILDRETMEIFAGRTPGAGDEALLPAAGHHLPVVGREDLAALADLEARGAGSDIYTGDVLGPFAGHPALTGKKSPTTTKKEPL